MDQSFVEDTTADRVGKSLLGRRVVPRNTAGASKNEAFWTGCVAAVGRVSDRAVYLITNVHYPNAKWEQCPLPDRYEPVYDVRPEPGQ